MQAVLTIPADAAADLYAGSAFYDESERISPVLDRIVAVGRFVGRDTAERSTSLKQIVACGVVRSDDEILCLRRSRKSNRSALRLRRTLLIGGHVDDQDEGAGCILRRCVQRELREEIGVDAESSLTLLGLVVDAETEVGFLHLGVVFDVPISTSTIELTGQHDTSEFVHAGKCRTVEFKPLAQLRRIAHLFDPWSRLFVASRFSRRLTGDEGTVRTHGQLVFPFAP